jgi:hypothetical protein
MPDAWDTGADPTGHDYESFRGEGVSGPRLRLRRVDESGPLIPETVRRVDRTWNRAARRMPESHDASADEPP